MLGTELVLLVLDRAFVQLLGLVPLLLASIELAQIRHHDRDGGYVLFVLLALDDERRLVRRLGFVERLHLLIDHAEPIPDVRGVGRLIAAGRLVGIDHLLE